MPTLVLWGESDGVVRPDYGRAYAELIPGARFELIEHAGHHPEIEQPEALPTASPVSSVNDRRAPRLVIETAIHRADRHA